MDMAQGHDDATVLLERVGVTVDGRERHIRVLQTGAGLVLEDGPNHRPLQSGNLLSALAEEPGILTVTPGITDIATTGDTDLRALLTSFRYQHDVSSTPDSITALCTWAADHADLDASQWFLEEGGDGGPILDMWAQQSEIELIPVWVCVNGLKAFFGRSGDKAGLGFMDPDAEEPIITRPLLDWSFYRESGGPVSWDGHGTLGECGPGLTVHSVRGDIDSGVVVALAPAPEDAPSAVADWLLAVEKVPAFLRAVFGTPGLDEETVRAIEQSGHVEGETVESYLSAEVEVQIVEVLTGHWPGVFWAMQALTDPDSERGKIVYAWLHVMAHGAYQAASWDHIDAAMFGQLGPPEPDQGPPPDSDRWAAGVAEATAAIERAHGWAPAVDIPAALLDTVQSADHLAVDPGPIQQAVARLEQDTALPAVTGARDLLGVDEAAGVTGAWKAYEMRAAEDPGAEPDLLDAYTLLARLDSRREELARMREDLAVIRSLEARASEIRWPSQWSLRYIPAWDQTAGTGKSARAWAEAGWHPRDVLTQGQLRCPWNADIDVRVVSTDVPPCPRDEKEG